MMRVRNLTDDDARAESRLPMEFLEYWNPAANDLSWMPLSARRRLEKHITKITCKQLAAWADERAIERAEHQKKITDYENAEFMAWIPDSFVVYLHRRETDGTIFYVGMGSIARSKQKKGRSIEWLAVEKQHGRTVEILDTFGTSREAAYAEIDAIEVLSGLGITLVNKSGGGEGGPKRRLMSHEDAAINLRKIMSEISASRLSLLLQ